MAQGEPGDEGMTPRRFATLAALFGAVVFAGWAVAEGLAGSGSSDTETTDAASMTDASAAGVADAAFAVAALLGSSPEPLAEEGTPVEVATLSPADPVPDERRNAVPAIELVDECLVVDTCIEEYLWAVYQRTKKVDTNKVVERRKVTVKKNGKTRTVVKSSTTLVDQDFTWKDPKAAERAGMSMKEYVIGGMDRGFKLKLFRALRALDEAGLAPGITSAFRDNYRQSYHGGSLRGGYGHGLAADLVSVKGETRGQRWISSEILWKWIDAHGQEYGIGRPYLDRDPPHVAPTDGKEYTDRRPGVKAQHAKSKITDPKPMSETAQSRRIDDSLGASASSSTPDVLLHAAN
jgi:hypothetical protein